MGVHDFEQVFKVRVELPRDVGEYRLDRDVLMRLGVNNLNVILLS